MLAARPDVAHVTGNPIIHNDLPQRGPIEESPLQPRSAPATIEPGITYTHAPDVWALGFTARLLLLQARIPVFAGRITRSSLITAAGMEQTRITILTGTTPSMTAWATLAGTIRQSLAMISSMAVIPSARRSATMAAPTRLEWRPAQNGSVAVTWTRATAHRPGTSSAWNFSWRLTHWAARRTKATRPKRLILPSTPGVARLRRVASPATSCKLLLKLKKLLVSRW